MVIERNLTMGGEYTMLCIHTYIHTYVHTHTYIFKTFLQVSYSFKNWIKSIGLLKHQFQPNNEGAIENAISHGITSVRYTIEWNHLTITRHIISLGFMVL